jgi:hypothetical protein
MTNTEQNSGTRNPKQDDQQKQGQGSGSGQQNQGGREGSGQQTGGGAKKPDMERDRKDMERDRKEGSKS